MAIGDVQNRLTVSPQFEQAGGAVNPNVVQDQNTAATQVNQPTATNQATEQTGQNINEPDTVLRQTPNTRIQDQGSITPAANTALVRQPEENTLLNTNQAGDGNVVPAGGGAEETLVNTPVERTAEEQINRIETANATAATTQPNLTAAVNALTPENQIGTRLDTIA